jgi:hypothetical protein
LPFRISACAAENARKGYFRALSPWREGALGANPSFRRAFAARSLFAHRNGRGRAARPGPAASSSLERRHGSKMGDEFLWMMVRLFVPAIGRRARGRNASGRSRAGGCRKNAALPGSREAHGSGRVSGRGGNGLARGRKSGLKAEGAYSLKGGSPCDVPAPGSGLGSSPVSVSSEACGCAAPERGRSTGRGRFPSGSRSIARRLRARESRGAVRLARRRGRCR